MTKKREKIKHLSIDIGLTILLFAGFGYLGFHAGSEPAYVFPRIEPQSYTVEGKTHNYIGVRLDDGSIYSGLYDKSSKNTEPVKFMNNVYSHPTIHGIISLGTGHGWNEQYQTSGKYDQENTDDRSIIDNPLASRGLVSKKGIPINQMITNRKKLRHRIETKGWKLEDQLTKGKHNKTVKGINKKDL